jgi:chorismate synthase
MLARMSHFRWMTSGESHGPELIALIDGCPAGLPLLASDVNAALARRQKGYGRGGRMKIEKDQAHLVAGVRGGETLGSPIALKIINRDFESWQGRMGPEPFASVPDAVIRPRPGHADLAGGLKYDRRDLRDILERASARETASRVAVGAVAQRLLAEVGISVLGHVVSIGTVDASVPPLLASDVDLAALRDRVHASDLACLDTSCEPAMREAIHAASHDGDTLGGVVEVVAVGVPAGLGSHVQWDRKIDGRLAQALMCIQAIKGVEIGLGFGAARVRGSEVHDPISYDASLHTFGRTRNHAGGIEGGITNGQPVVCRAAMKPIATLRRALGSVDVVSKEAQDAAHERSDICAVAAASVVAEAMVAITLVDALLEKTGGDSLGEVRRNLAAFVEHQRAFPV